MASFCLWETLLLRILAAVALAAALVFTVENETAPNVHRMCQMLLESTCSQAHRGFYARANTKVKHFFRVYCFWTACQTPKHCAAVYCDTGESRETTFILLYPAPVCLIFISQSNNSAAPQIFLASFRSLFWICSIFPVWFCLECFHQASSDKPSAHCLSCSKRQINKRDELREAGTSGGSKEMCFLSQWRQKQSYNSSGHQDKSKFMMMVDFSKNVVCVLLAACSTALKL